MLDAFTARNFSQDFGDFVGMIGWRQQGYIFPHDLFWSVAIDALGALVPCGNGAIQAFADDRVLGGIDNQGQPRAGFPQLLDGSLVQFFMRSAQFFFNFLAIADIADRAQDENSMLRGNRTETNLYREFRAIAPSAVEIEPGSHSSRLRGLREVLAMMMVLAAIALRDEHFDLLAHQFVAVIAK